MIQTSGHLIIFSNAGQLWRIQFSRIAIVLLILGFLASFGLVVFIGYTFPPLISDTRQSQLETENRALCVEIHNLSLRVKRLDAEVAGLEAAAGRITNHVNAD